MFKENQSISEGCKINLLKQRTRIRSLYQTTRRIYNYRKGILCFQIEEGTIWTQKIPQSMVFKIGQVYTIARVQERKCRQQSIHKGTSK